MNATAAVELRLGVEADAPSRARRFVSEFVGGMAGLPEGDAELVVTELVTNAVLHGQPPIVVRLSREDGNVLRVEVEDSGRELPVRPRENVEAMTGRGLALVAALSRAWGLQPLPDQGKVVWAELGGDPGGSAADESDPIGGLDMDALLASWADDEEETVYEVHVGDVPTGLLLEAKTHLDNVVRELTLADRGGESSGARLPAAMQHLVTSVTEDFAEARGMIKRQAIAAADRGEAMTDLTLRLPLSTADAAERYLAAMDEADRYARAAHLLTLAAPAAHRVFRRWYVGAIVDQLRAHAGGRTPPRPPLFADMVTDEVNRLAGLQASAERLHLLVRVTQQLATATSVEEAAHAVVHHVPGGLGVESVRVYLQTPQATLRLMGSYGEIPTAGRGLSYSEFGLDADLPGAVVARTGEAILRRSYVGLDEAFKDLTLDTYPGERSLHVLPLICEGRTLGVLSLTFLARADDDEQALDFVLALAAALAQALERVTR